MAQTVYWVIIPSGATAPANDLTGAAQVRNGLDGANNAATASGSEAMPGGTGVINVDESTLPTSLTPGTSYKIAATIWDGTTYGGGTSTYVTVSGAIDTLPVLDLAGSRSVSLSGAVTASGDLQYTISLGGSQTASLSGSLGVAGDIEITPAPTLDLAGSQTAALVGVLSATGDLQYTLPIDLSQSAAAALSGSLSIAGDLEYSTAVFLDIAAQPITLAGAFSTSGDLDPYPSLDLAGAQSVALSGSVTASGDLQYTIPFSITQTGATALSGTLALSGDLEYSTTPIPPPASPGWGGGAVGGGGKGLRELTARIAKDAKDLLERKRKAPNAQISQPAALEPAPVPTRKTSSRGAGSSESVDRVAAEPAVPGSQAEVLSELRSLRGAVEKLEALILADREEAHKRREQDEEEAAVVKLLLN